MATAGRSVVFAGVTVVISLLGMLTMNQPYVPGVAFSAVVTVLAVMLAALTLLPALLGFAGRNIDRLRHAVPPSVRRARRARLLVPVEPDRSSAGRSSPGSPARSPSACSSRRSPGCELGFPDAGNDPTNLTTRRAYDLMTDGFGAGFNGTFVLVADRGDDEAHGGARPISKRTLAATPGVAAVSPPIASPDADAAVITLTPRRQPAGRGDRATCSTRLRDDDRPRRRSPAPTSTVTIGGITAADVDQTNSISARLPMLHRRRDRAVVPAAAGGVPLGARRGQGRRAEPAVDHRRLRRRRLRRRGRMVRPAVRHHHAHPDPGVHPDDDVRDPLRPVDGLRGVPALTSPRGVPHAPATTRPPSPTAWPPPPRSSPPPR